MTRFRWILATLVLTLFAFSLQPVQAQDLTMAVGIKAKAGSEAGFEAALKAHMEYREANGDPWDWRFFQVVVGKDNGSYMARSSNHTWADFDEYFGSDFGQVADPHWGATVQPLVEDSWSLVDQTNNELSRLPENMDPYTLFNVSVFYLKPDKQMAFTEAIEKYRQVIVDKGFPFYWVVNYPVAGAEGPTMALVGFAEIWAEMAEDPAVEEALVEVYGEDGAQELFEQFNGSFHHFENYIAMLRPDLSSGGGM